MSTSRKYIYQPVEASTMLEAALQQMDGIIAGTQVEISSFPDRSLSPPINMIHLCEKFKENIRYNHDLIDPDDIDEETQEVIVEWLTKGKAMNMKEQIIQLDADKESLQLQVNILSEQVEGQNGKIRELEKVLEQKQAHLSKTEEYYQKEIMNRSTLETQRLELLSEISNLKLQQAAYERENLDLSDKIRLSELTNHDPMKNDGFNPNAASTPLHTMHKDFYDTIQTPPSQSELKIEKFSTLPYKQRDVNIYRPSCNTTGRCPKGVMFATTEKMENFNGSLADPIVKGGSIKGTSTISPFMPQRSPSVGSKPSGIKKIFTRLRRSSSDQIGKQSSEERDLKRGGIRATAIARLGWSSQMTTFREPTIPFSSWNATHVEEWLVSLSLSQYGVAARAWMKNGNHICKASSHELEKEIGVRHPLHRKKLQLAISCKMGKNSMYLQSSKLDTAWVLRWLDDIALPQYKDVFHESRIDGLVLNYLTFEDLTFLKITNLLHATSLKRGIQVMRKNNFNNAILKRRSSPEDSKLALTATDVSLWTNHRVMEWLKTVDLSEYAPNLRGSGVHGGLMIYEVKFTSELLASLLSISSNKTLLRRHLNIHFNQLLGKKVVQCKRETEINPNNSPLSISVKLKITRKSQFSLRKKKSKSDLEFYDLLCPLEEILPSIEDNDSNKEEGTSY